MWLAATVASAAEVCDHIIAVDGAYLLFPDGEPRSGPEQAAAIQEVCAATGMGCSIHTPKQVWEGNEVEKRSFLFRAAELIANPGDWYMVLDADEVISRVPPDLRERLEQTDLDVAEVTFREHDDFDTDPVKAEQARRFDYPREHTFRVPILFRAIPGLRVERNHYTYVTPDGRNLWGNEEREPALDCSDLLIEHRTHLRDLNRRGRAKSYYKRRDQVGIELHPCWLCKDAPGRHAVKADPERDGMVLKAASVMVCDECLPQAKAASDELVRCLGFDPETLVYEGPE